MVLQENVVQFTFYVGLVKNPAAINCEKKVEKEMKKKLEETQWYFWQRIKHTRTAIQKKVEKRFCFRHEHKHKTLENGDPRKRWKYFTIKL